VTAQPASVHGKYALLLAVAVTAAIPYGWHAAASVALGGGIQALNLRALERSVRVIAGMAKSEGERVAAAGMSIAVLRFGAFIAAVVTVLATLPIDPLVFLASMLLILPAVSWHALAQRSAGNGREA
jgi:uncharacterized membrane protein